MKKLMSVLFTVLFTFGVVFATPSDSVRSAVYDNNVYASVVVGNVIYTATNGGIEIFSKDGSNLPGESLPWKVYNTLNSGLPHNLVHSLAVDSQGNIFAMGYNWFAYRGSGDGAWHNIPVEEAEGVVVGRDDVKWAVLTVNNIHGLYRDGGNGFQYVPLSQEISGSIEKMAVGGYGTGKDSAFCTVWGTRSGGIFRYDAITGTEKDWKVGDQLIAGSPNNIAISGDTVAVVGETGIYIFIFDAASSPIVIAYPPETVPGTGPSSMPHNNKGAISFLKGKIYVGSTDGQLYSCTMNSGFSLAYGNNVGDSRLAVNSMVADGESIYASTDWHLRIYTPGNGYIEKSITSIRYPHSNNITTINRDNTGRILVGTSDGGYRYDVNENSPSLKSSVQNIGGNIVTYFVDRYGVEWIGKLGRWERIDGGQRQIFDDGAVNEMFNKPYWFVGNTAGDVVLVTSSSNMVWIYAGNGTWACKNNQPARMAKEKILSVNSSGKHLFIATDSAAYIYDFTSIWATQSLSYSANRKICGDETLGAHAWIAEESVLYSATGSDVGLQGNCPWSGRKINDLVIDQDNLVWVATDSGVVCAEKSGDVVAVLTVELADKFVNTIRIVYADGEKQAWFGTAGGLTVWHQSIVSSVKPTFNSLVKKSSLVVGQNVEYFDVGGRKIVPNNIKTLAYGQVVLCRVNGRITKLKMNLSGQLR